MPINDCVKLKPERKAPVVEEIDRTIRKHGIVPESVTLIGGLSQTGQGRLKIRVFVDEDEGIDLNFDTSRLLESTVEEREKLDAALGRRRP